MATPDLIGKYLNLHLYTDIYPIGKIIGIKGKSTVILAKVTHEKDPEFKLEIIPGGFSGHCVNNDEQKWIYHVDETVTKEKKLTVGSLKRGLYISDTPLYHYDYNF